MLLNKKAYIYKQLVDKLYDKCQRIQAENERCVMRVNGIKKILRRRIYDVDLLKRRLDKHGDQWRTVPMVVQHPKGKTEQKRRGPKPKNKQQPNSVEGGGAGAGAAPIGGSTTARKPRKQRVKKTMHPQPMQPQAQTIPMVGNFG